MDVAALARREHENMIATMSLAAHTMPGGVVRLADGVAVVATGLPVLLFNQVLVAGDDARPDAIEAAVALVRERGDEFVVNLRMGEDDRHLPLMAHLGLVPLSPEPWMPGMALDPLDAAAAAAGADLPGHAIRRVTDAAGVADFVRTGAAGFGMPQDWFEAVINESYLAEPGVRLYVGYTDGEPVTTGLGVRTGDTIGIYTIATVEHARRRGYGAAMTSRIVADGAAEGCDAAVLQASDMGYPIYERMGFRTVVSYMGYVDPG